MIITNNEDALKIPCTDATPDEAGPLIDQLERELDNSAKLGRPGIGLAAPQIGIYKKVAIVRYDNISINLVNCKIENQYDLFMFSGEGCLSFPGRIENTMRYGEIYVVDNLSHPDKFIVSGLAAVVCQHELDHLNGVLLPEKALKKINKKVSPNDPCPCGKIDITSMKPKKYKKCCGK